MVESSRWLRLKLEAEVERQWLHTVRRRQRDKDEYMILQTHTTVKQSLEVSLERLFSQQFTTWKSRKKTCVLMLRLIRYCRWETGMQQAAAPLNQEIHIQPMKDNIKLSILV